MRRLFAPLNTIFGRLALLSVVLLVMTQLTSLLTVDRDRGLIEADHIGRLVHLAFDTPPGAEGEAARARIAAVLDLHFVDVARDAAPLSCPAPCANTGGPFEVSLLAHLPAESRVVFSPSANAVWVRYGTAPRWVIVPASVPPMSRLIGANLFMLFFAITIALIGAWQIQKPVLRLARAAREFRLGHHPPDVRADGPAEVKSLIGDFNEMARALSDAEQERAVMLAGVAHDLRAPITRIQVRANLVPEASVRAGFFHDAESLAQIVTQFLDFARDTEADANAPWVSVDAFCRNHYADHDAETSAENTAETAPAEALFELDLHAGESFRLPAIELDRILSNLVENAFTYGAPPLRISTSRAHGRDRLTVRDHGAGMPDTQFASALKPFVRLDPARGGDAHCGLGLTIVRRLARRYNGDLSLSNAPGGGLAVTLDFPSQRPV